jgi:excisionase family DNA binding protein
MSISLLNSAEFLSSKLSATSMNEPKSNLKRDFLSTREAATRLGVALSTVQLWVETGVLPAWKTPGGHRRIPADVIDSIQARQRSVLSSTPTPELFRALVVEDDPVQRELYSRQFSEWNLPIQLFMAEDGFEGLVLIGRHSPDLVITDLAMPEMDGFKMIRRLKPSRLSPGASSSSLLRSVPMT